MRRVTILGTGATARSALLSAAQLGAEQVTVVGRTPTKAAGLQGLGLRLDLDVRVQDWTSPLPGVDLVISTATAGAADAIAPAVVASAPVVFDALYDPWPTVLASVAARAGCTVINGLDLLIGQALLQIELMTGRSVPAASLYAALPDDLTDAAQRAGKLRRSASQSNTVLPPTSSSHRRR
jgi:shikimate dehydrogenase